MYDYDEQNYKEDYEQEILEIIEKVVAEKVEQGTKAFMKEKEQIQKNTEKKVELNNTIRNLGTENSKLEKKVYHLEMEILNAEKAKKEEIEKIKIDFGNDYLKTIVGEWKEGDKAYFIDERDTNTDCPNCHGTGKTTAELSNGQKAKITCNFCGGSKWLRICEQRLNYHCVEDMGVYLNRGKPYLGFRNHYRSCKLSEYCKDKAVLDAKIKEYNGKQDNELKKRYEEYKKNNI